MRHSPPIRLIIDPVIDTKRAADAWRRVAAVVQTASVAAREVTDAAPAPSEPRLSGKDPNSKEILS